jgi:hypothetical protein
MKSLFRIVFVLGLLAIPSAFAQDLQLPRDSEKLMERVQAFWRNFTAGQRLQAAEFVLPEKKNLFVSGNPVPVVKAVVQGVDLTPDREKATVRVSVTVLGTDLSSGQANWTISDTWIWRRGNWYADVQDANSIFPEGRLISKADQQKIQESIDKSFEILRNPIELGKLTDGQHFSVEVPIKYTGDLPISIEPATPNPVVSMPVSPPIRSDSKSFTIYIGTDDWEGPFNFPLVLNVKYREITVQRKLNITGEVFVPVAFRQDPPNGPLVEGKEFSVFVLNNTDEEIRGFLSVDARLDILQQTNVFPPHKETQLIFRPKPHVAPPDGIAFQWQQPVSGKSVLTYRLRNVQP